jgi:hypothetical protein
VGGWGSAYKCIADSNCVRPAEQSNCIGGKCDGGPTKGKACTDDSQCFSQEIPGTCSGPQKCQNF